MTIEQHSLPLEFNTRIWRSDGKLRKCSFGARGLWADLLSLIHDEGSPYGYLLLGGQRPTATQLARMLGGTPRTIERLTAELERNGVFSRDAYGTIFSRRMVRDGVRPVGGVDNCHFDVRMTSDRRQNGAEMDSSTPPGTSSSSSEFPIPNPIEKPESKILFNAGMRDGKVGDKNGAKTNFTIEDPLQRLARFQAKIAQHLGRAGWDIVGSAADRADPEHDRCLALCKAAAQDIGKGWPRLWT